jgi:hypothetical protein
MGWFKTDKSTKYAQALLKVSANLFEVATEAGRRDHAPLVLRFERPDSKLRYMAFCLGTTYYFSVQQNTLSVFEEALRKSWDHVTSLAMTSDGATGFFTGSVNRAQAIQDSGVELARTVEGWKGYAAHFAARKAARQSLERDENTARIISAMLHRVESMAVLTEDDALRLMPLARWIEETTASIGPSVEQLAR